MLGWGSGLVGGWMGEWMGGWIACSSSTPSPPTTTKPNPQPTTHNPQPTTFTHAQVPGLGVVSYCWVRSLVGRAAFVVGDPLAPPHGMLALLARFHEAVPGMKLYVAVSQVVADALRHVGWSATVFGNDYYGVWVCGCW
jgi:hypothetical protein